ncbi:MAG: hypothetical protein OEZ06_29075 [Myxococcales bacterium]|nr:hypothetical protein [Myxococcales bacterium]
MRPALVLPTMTILRRYADEFPDAEESRSILLVDKATKQVRDHLWLDERFCADPECDCRRAFIFMVGTDGRELAMIGYAFDEPIGLVDGIPNPHLEENWDQSERAGELLNYVRLELEKDPKFCARIARHYDEVKERMSDPEHPLLPAVLEDRSAMTDMARLMLQTFKPPPSQGPSRERREQARKKRRQAKRRNRR